MDFKPTENRDEGSNPHRAPLAPDGSRHRVHCSTRNEPAAEFFRIGSPVDSIPPPVVNATGPRFELNVNVDHRIGGTSEMSTVPAPHHLP